MRHYAMSVRLVLGLVLGAALALAWTACTSSPSPGSSAPASCASQGYLPTEEAGACPTGLCATAVGALTCCGSLCATCEDKGLISYTEAGACPPNTCPSSDVTLSLACCAPVAPDQAPCEDEDADAGTDAPLDSPPEALADAPADAPPEVAADL
jgi:hypothetical protein